MERESTLWTSSSDFVIHQSVWYLKCFCLVVHWLSVHYVLSFHSANYIMIINDESLQNNNISSTLSTISNKFRSWIQLQTFTRYTVEKRRHWSFTVSPSSWPHMVDAFYVMRWAPVFFCSLNHHCYITFRSMFGSDRIWFCRRSLSLFTPQSLILSSFDVILPTDSIITAVAIGPSEDSVVLTEAFLSATKEQPSQCHDQNAGTTQLALFARASWLATDGGWWVCRWQ